MKGFALLLTHSLMPISPIPPSFLGRYSLTTLLLVCRQPPIAKIFLVLLSMLATSSIVQSTIPALKHAIPTAQVLMPPIKFPPLSFELHNFFYPSDILRCYFVFHLGVESLVQPYDAKVLVAFFLYFPDMLVFG